MGSTKSLKWNASANFIGLGYTTVIGILILPLYLKYLGPEAFGLVGFFTVLQSWMQLFDLGMTPMLSRQAAQARGQNIGFKELRKLLRSLELVVLVIAIFIVLSIGAGSTWIAYHWLNVTSLDLGDVTNCIVIMGAVIGLRLFSSLYSGGVQGMENQIQLNALKITFATFRYAGVLLLFHFITQDVVYYFLYQFSVSLIELAVLSLVFYRLVPTTNNVRIGFYWDTLKPILPFAGGIAYASIIWVLLTQLDKIILSTVLPLSEYGYFALAAIVSAAILKIPSPLSQAILPRMTRLIIQGKEQDMVVLYRKSTQFMSVIMLPLTGIIAIFSTELLFAWTGDREAAEWAGPILFWFALGNGILAISAFQYYLQFAHGKLRMHVIYNSVSASIHIPVIIYVAFEYGALGVALAWFTLRLISFLIWTPIVHNKYAPGVHWSWLTRDVAPILLSTMVVLFFITRLEIGFSEMGRSQAFVVLFGMGLVALIPNVIVSSASRGLILSLIQGARR